MNLPEKLKKFVPEIGYRRKLIEKGKYQSAGVLAFTTLVLAALIYFSDFTAVKNIVSSANYSWLVLAAFSANIPLLIYSFTWKKILKASGLEIGYFRTFQLVLSNVFVNNITPFGNIGGEAAITYILSKITGESSGRIFSMVLVASLINFLPLASLLAAGLMIAGYWRSVSLIFLGFFALFLAVKKFSWSFRDITGVQKLPSRVEDFITDFRDALEIFSGRKKLLTGLVVFSHSWLVFDVLSVILIGYAFGLDLFSPLILIVIPLARVANYVPTPGGSGPYEVALAGLLHFFIGTSVAEGVLVAVNYRVLTYYIGLVLGYVSLNLLISIKSI